MSETPEAWNRKVDAVVERVSEAIPQPVAVKRRLTIDEILDEVSALAQDPQAGADRFRALKMLATTESAAVVLPEPRADGEVVDRLARVMKGAGIALTQIAYKRAFPSTRYAADAGPKLRYADATPEMRERAQAITSLKMLNRRYAEGKVRGTPKGYPARSSNAAKIEWCRTQALRMEVERVKHARSEAHAEIRDADNELRATTEGQDVEINPEDLP